MLKFVFNKLRSHIWAILRNDLLMFLYQVKFIFILSTQKNINIKLLLLLLLTTLAMQSQGSIIIAD